MKKILLFLSMLCMTGCYTNIINDYGGDGGGNGGNGGNDGEGGFPSSGMEVDKTLLTPVLSADAQAYRIEFRANGSWYVNLESDEDWFTVDPLYSEMGGSSVITIYLDENTTGSPREFHAVLSDNTGGGQIHVVQKPEREDGSYPVMEAPVQYSEMIDRVTIAVSESNGTTKDVRRWDIHYDGNRVAGIEKMYIYENEIDGNTIVPEEITSFYGNMNVDQRVFDGSLDPMVKMNVFKECRVNNESGYVMRENTIYDYPEEGVVEEPVMINYLYKDSYLQQVGVAGEVQTIYRWNGDNNKVEAEYDGMNICSYTYGTELNDKAIIDINELISEDVMALSGYHGKRSTNLLSSISMNNGDEYRFDYQFDSQRRVTEVTVSYFVNGVEQPQKTVYSLSYSIY